MEFLTSDFMLGVYAMFCFGGLLLALVVFWSLSRTSTREADLGEVEAAMRKTTQELDKALKTTDSLVVAADELQSAMAHLMALTTKAAELADRLEPKDPATEEARRFLGEFARGAEVVFDRLHRAVEPLKTYVGR